MVAMTGASSEAFQGLGEPQEWDLFRFQQDGLFYVCDLRAMAIYVQERKKVIVMRFMSVYCRFRI